MCQFQYKDTSELAVGAVRCILRSCQNSGSVKRVIYTGSVTASSPLKDDGTGFKEFMDESCWTPLHLSFPHCEDFVHSYITSKTLAEKEVLNYNHREDKNGLELVSLACGLVGGDSLIPNASLSVQVIASPLMGNPLCYKQLNFMQVDFYTSDYPTMQAFVDYYDRNYPMLSVTKEIEGTADGIPCISRKLVDAGFRYRYGMKQILDGSVECMKSLEGYN